MLVAFSPAPYARLDTRYYKHRTVPQEYQCCAKNDATSHRARKHPVSIGVCHGPTCSISGGGVGLLDSITLLFATANEESPEDGPNVQIDACGCLGQCSPGGANIGIARPSSKPLLYAGIRSVSDLSVIMQENQYGQVKPSPDIISGLQAKEDANKAFLNGKYGEAIELYTKALLKLEVVRAGSAGREAADKIRAGILANRSGAWAKSDRHRALEDAHAAIDLQPDLVAGWKRKGDAEESLGNRDVAAQAIEMASKLEASSKQKKALAERAQKLRRPTWRII